MLAALSSSCAGDGWALLMHNAVGWHISSRYGSHVLPACPPSLSSLLSAVWALQLTR